MTTSDSTVAALGQAIAQRIGEPSYRVWFNGKTKLTWEDRLLVVGVPNRFYQDWLQHRFADAVRAAANDILGPAMQVRFAIDAELFQATHNVRIEETTPPPAAGKVEPTGSRGDTARKRARRWHRLDEFVVGPCNRLAHAAALSIVEAPGQCANPLALHGPSGTGKTHLLEGIRAGLARHHSGWTLRLVSAEEFTNAFFMALKQGQMASFRKQFRGCDALLVDDLHFLAKKRVTQEEFVNTFDALLADGKQIVVSCDCHPRLADELIPELTDRLMGGSVWGLEPPDAAIRLAILRAKSLRAEPGVPDDVLRLLADQLRGNVRELEGALHSIRHFSLVTGRPIDVALAREAVADLLRYAVRVVQLADVDRHLCAVLHMEGRALHSKQRAWAVSHPRMVAMYLARKHTGASYSEIGQYFGGRNHSTVVAAEKKVRRWLEGNEELVLGKRREHVRHVIERVERELRR